MIKAPTFQMKSREKSEVWFTKSIASAHTEHPLSVLKIVWSADKGWLVEAGMTSDSNPRPEIWILKDSRIPKGVAEHGKTK